MSEKVQSGAHSRHLLTYHLMWVIKYRRTVLTREMSARLKVMIQNIVAEIGCEVLAVEDDVDHALVV
jgi:putative transposase